MKAKRFFLMVWLPLFIIIFGYGMYYTSTQNLSTGMIEQGVVIFLLYGAAVAAVVAAIATGVFRVATRGRKTTPPPAATPRQ